MNSTQPVLGLIFDLDGTLLDSALDLSLSVNAGRNHFGLPPLSNETVASFVGDGINNLITRSFSDSPLTLEEVKPFVSAYYEEHMLDNTKPYPGVGETLKRLPQKKAVVTNKPERFVPGMLKRFGLLGFFDCIICGDSLPERKPHPSVGFEAARKLNVKPEEMVIIGDHSADLNLAINCGMRSIFCTYGIGKQEGLPYTWSIDAFVELQKMAHLKIFPIKGKKLLNSFFDRPILLG